MGEQKKKDTVCPFSFVKEPKQGVLRANYSRRKTTMRREWGVDSTCNINDTVCPFSFVKEPKQGVSGAKLCFALETTIFSTV